MYLKEVFKKASMVIALAVALCSAIVWYSYYLAGNVSEVDRLWAEYNKTAYSELHYLKKIEKIFSDSQFKRNYQGYALAKDLDRLPGLEESLMQAQDAVNQLLALVITRQEKAALSQIANIIDSYLKNLKSISELYDQNLSPLQVFKAVTVNDESAAQAFTYLASQRGNYIENNRLAIQSKLRDMGGDVHYALWLVPVVLVAALVVIMFMGKLIKAHIYSNKTKKYLTDLLEVIPDAIFTVDTQGQILAVNGQATTMLGYTKEEFLQMSIEDIIPQQYRSSHKKLRNAYFNQPKLSHMKNRPTLIALTKQGGEVPVEISLSYVRQEDKVIAIATVRDISDRIRADMENRQTAVVFENTDEGIVVADANGKVVNTNHAFTIITGYTLADVENKDILSHYRYDNREQVFTEIQKSLDSTGKWRGELWGKRKTGERYPAWLNISVVKDEGGQVINYIVVFSDISVIKQTEQWLTHLAQHDDLTQLPNRNHFSENLRQTLEFAKRRNRQVALLFLDLDRFKIINDTLGHASGDRLLQKVAERLKNSVRSEDMVARIGGDEFTVVMKEINNTEDAAKVAQKIIQQLSLPITIDDREVVTSSSVGISIFPTDADDMENLTKAADTAMYRAKEQGRNNYQFYSSELTQQAFERLLLEQGMRKALNNNEFVLYYQPQISLTTGDVVGVEALIRWQHPEMGLVSPFKFIPIAEETGLIRPIGEWVIKAAWSQACSWFELGIQPLRISVNISARQMLDESSLNRLEALFNELQSGSDAIKIDLEITESDLRIADQSADTLQRLKEMGVGLAIDDFGTGYSSLSRLKQLPIDVLKIDRSFVKDIPHDKDDEAIAAAVISMGRSLNLKVIAEGVETQEQLEFLKLHGCDEMQGDLFSPPLTAENVVQLLNGSQKAKKFIA